MTVKGLDGIHRTLKRNLTTKYLKRPWCRTGHSIQGQTIGDKLYIHDAETWMATARWLRTAITRCQTLDIVLVTYKNPTRLSKRVVRKRIELHLKTDEEKGRAFNAKNYVSVDWAIAKIRSQGYACATCLESLDMDWSIDRIDNARAHVKENCQISCRRCQHASSHR